jgi:hypothetical protein
MKKSFLNLALVFFALIFSQNALVAQAVSEVSNTKYTDLPSIFASVPKQFVNAQTILERQAGTFFENLVLAQDGTLLVTSLFDGKILSVSPAGEAQDFAQISGILSGITLDKKGNIVAVGAFEGKVPSVFHIDSHGKLLSTTPVEGAWLLNGITRLEGDRFLIADSYTDRIFEFDLLSKKSSIWLADETLARTGAKVSIPGVNGLKIYNGVLYATNMDKAQIVKIPILSGGKAGRPDVWVRGVFGDDFSIDHSGNVYLTTHAYNSVVKITADGRKTIIGEKIQGLTGATSLAFGKGKFKHSVFVVTNGGVLIPPAEGIQKALIVRLDLQKSAEGSGTAVN